MNQKGFAPILIILGFVIVLLGAGGYYLYVINRNYYGNSQDLFIK